MKNLLFFCSILFSFMNFARSLNISFYIMDKEEICFGEFLSKHTLVVGSFDINIVGSPHYIVRVIDPKKDEVFKRVYNPNESIKNDSENQQTHIVEDFGDQTKNETINIEEKMIEESIIRSEHLGGDNLIRFSFATYDDGPHDFCLKNLDQITYKVKFLMKTGVEAKDYTVLTKKQHLKELAKETFMIHTTANFIKEDYAAISELELHKIYHSGQINSNVMLYGCITVVVLIFVALFQYYSMKRFFKKKKII